MSQDTLMYYQENAALFSNSYFLYPATKTFEHWFYTDDGQVWYGKGEYEKKNSKLFFDFGDSEKREPSKVYFELSNTNTDSILICVKDKTERFLGGDLWVGNHLTESSWENEIKIAKTALKDNDLVSIGNIPLETIEFKLPNIDSLSKVTIITPYAPSPLVHYESNFGRIAKMTSKYLITLDYYNTSRKKKIKFKLE